jgi:urease accessory protein UreF
MLDEHGETLARAHREAMERPVEEAASPFPLLDLRQGFHDAMYARLFLS